MLKRFTQNQHDICGCWAKVQKQFPFQAETRIPSRNATKSARFLTFWRVGLFYFSVKSLWDIKYDVLGIISFFNGAQSPPSDKNFFELSRVLFYFKAMNTSKKALVTSCGLSVRPSSEDDIMGFDQGVMGQRLSTLKWKLYWVYGLSPSSWKWSMTQQLTNGHWHLWSHHIHDRAVLSVVWVSTTGGKRLTTSSEVSWPSVYTAAVAASELPSRYISHVSSAVSFHFLDIPATVSVSSVQPIMGQMSSVQTNASSNRSGSRLHGLCDAAQPASASLLSARQEYPECHRVTLRPVRGSTGCAVSHCPPCLPTQLPPGPKNLHTHFL